jgi:hypothetical protein
MMWLSETELQNLTKRVKPSAQVRELVRSGIPFRVVAGRPVVLKESLLPSKQPLASENVLEARRLLLRQKQSLAAPKR